MLLASTDVSLDLFLQYGAFGLIAFLVFWFIAIFAPKFTATIKEWQERQAVEHRAGVEKLATEHGAAITRLIMAFEKEAEQCREERLAVAEVAAEEREKDRLARHELANAVQKALGGK